jgi:hypothetical protein
MSQFALIESGFVSNIILWDGVTAYEPPAGSSAVAIPAGETVAIGFGYVGGGFVAPPAPAAPAITPAAAAAAQYAAAIAAGLAVTSTGTPTLDGVYGIEPSDVSDIMAEVQFIAAFAEFTNTTTTMLLWTQQGSAVPVAFISTAQFMSFAKQAAQYVAACKLAADTVAAGGTATWPSNAATIP